MTAYINELFSWGNHHALLAVIIAFVGVISIACLMANPVACLALVGTVGVLSTIVVGFVAAIHWMTLSAVNPQSWQFAAALGASFIGLLTLSRLILMPVRGYNPGSSDEIVTGYMSKTSLLAGLGNNLNGNRFMMKRATLQGIQSMDQGFKSSPDTNIQKHPGN
jgi:hypothetical protein